MSDTLFNIVLLWLDILDLPPRQCIYTLAIEGWTALPAELRSAILLQMNSTPKFALALVFGGFLLRQKQISMALPTHCRTYLQVIHILHPFTALEYSCHKFRCGACDFEYLSSRRISMFPFHGFKLRFWVMVVNPLLIAYNHTWMEDSWVCVIPGQQGGTKTVWIHWQACFLHYNANADYLIFKHHLMDFLDIFLRTLRNFTTRIVLILNVLPSPFQLSWPRCNCRIAWAGLPYTMDKRLWNLVVVSLSCERNCITALYSNDTILTKWEISACLLK